ncbi:hypothetical protein SARC_12045 [Sphaeroforma arctica JP610]|uniref:Uncharacterized protein n=1 Tax=Sphaeroforma arctica JP610 TaxID=667725 RepID=A0A0L0FF75_9EUKA|nr:hypothetical protein SARC_12045 [Sphaeroforma arctica JP610]KNC75429.1 hypothetical protein SARC_12045 [Sphaeroforma arctica JP610]|eukprot:XP_014149331.1 hypothetical protein SARC_12045 [Sphaeroforma arctica JP610]
MSGSNLDSEQKVVDRISDSNKDTEMTDAEEAVESTSKDTNKGDASEVSQSEQTESNAEVTDTEESVKNNSDVLSNKDKAESSEMSSNQEYGESTRDVKATTNSVVSAEEVLEGKADDSVDATTEKIAEGTDEVENEAGKPKSTNEDGTANDTKSESELNKDSTDVGSVVAKKTDESSQADSKTDKNSSDEPERAQHDETDKKGVDDSIGMSSVAENGNADVGVSDETTGDQPAEKDHTDDHTREIVAETDTVQPDKDEGGSEMILNDTDKGEGPDGARDRPTADAVNQGDEMEATEYNEPEEVYLEEGEGEGAELDLMEMEEQEAPEEFAETEEAHDDGFVLLGSACTNYIEHNLAAGDPIDFIGQFQADSGLKIDHRSLAALPFLDVFGVPRSSLHKSFLESMREKLSERIKKLASSDIDTLNTLLEKSFIYFTHPELQDIPINIMKRLPVIPESILHHISISDEIYEACPMDVKRKVWLHANNAEGQARFRKIVYATITNFMDDETILRAQNDFTDLNPIPPKRRRQHAAVKNLVDIIGKSSEVYHMVLKLFETLFKNTQNRLYCTLRSELLMAFHDADVAEVSSVQSPRALPLRWYHWLVMGASRLRRLGSST